MGRSILKIILTRIISFLIFLILLAVANFLTRYVNFQIYKDIIGFFDSNLILLVTMMALALVNEIFWNYYFPFNILAPITSSALGVVIVRFIFLFWEFVNSYVNLAVNIPMIQIYLAVFWLVLICGYIIILFRKGKPKQVGEEEAKELKKKKDRDTDDQEIRWEDVDEQFRRVFYNIGRSINRRFENKENTDKSKKKSK